MNRSEYLCVIIIIASVVMLNTNACCLIFERHSEHSKTRIAKIQILEFEGAIVMFRHDTGRYPAQSEGLKILTSNFTKVSGWQGPYLIKALIPNDPWGRPYIYRCPGKFGDFDILSFGQDGRIGGTGEDSDISNK